jgi:hypothetical protein
VHISRGMVQVAVPFPISLFHTTMTSINTTTSIAGAQISIPPTDDNESNTAAVASNIDFETVILSLRYASDSTGTAIPSLSVQGTDDVEDILCEQGGGIKAARSIRDINRFSENMLSRHPAGSESQQNEWHRVFTDGLKKRVKQHNESKAESYLGLSFADEPVADLEIGLKALDMNSIIYAAAHADLIDMTNRRVEKLKAARLAAEKQQERDLDAESSD